MRTWFLCSLLISVITIQHSEARSLKRKPAEAAKVAADSTETKVITDFAIKVKEDDGGINVIFSMNPKETYYLALDTANYDNMRKALEESVKTKKPVSVTVNTSLSNIVEVK